ncbi:hypothetical protein [Desulfuromonas sp. AOP6]|uniref:hypothetical protein n=1 Tax=Desulfuromonas sp. AOP6 TaxID=1566351 RepID=UPI00127E3683|nr:hypothetical protein [Desulfuromonas sp. AOP6]BCA79091.1 hypothetical protein AOP6_0878 [Desulfuromonas sp. AOP6]
MTTKVAVEKVLNASIENIEEEITGLLGAEVTLQKHRSRPVSRTDFFSGPRDYFVVSKLEVSGGLKGTCYLVLDLKAAITLGSTLVMLPQDLINKRLMKATLEEEEADAFGEVANIIAGAYSNTFAKHFPHKLHFKKTEVKSYIPEEMDAASDEPFPEDRYYLSTSELLLKGKSLGQMEALFPLDLLEYQENETSGAPVKPAGQEEKRKTEESPTTAPGWPASAETPPAAPAVESADSSPREEAPGITAKDIEKTLQAGFTQIEEELGAFLGQEITFSGYSGRVVNKQAYLTLPRDYSVSTTLDVSGDASGQAYLVVDLKSAITLGGTLILLPPETIAKNLRKSLLEGEEKDAFGEITNLVAGTCSQIFPKIYPRKIRFVKTEVQTFVPEETDPQSPTPFPPDDYYLSSCTMRMGKKDLGQLDILIPLAILGYVPPEQRKASTKSPPATEEPLPSGLGTSAAAAHSAPEPQVDTGTGAAIVVAEEIKDAEPFVKNLTGAGYQCKHFTFQENFNEAFATSGARVVFLVMRDVNSQTLAAIIKVRAALKKGQPLIAAGPQWTRSSVIKAVKYGVTDILVTPIDGGEIIQKVQAHLSTSLPESR